MTTYVCDPARNRDCKSPLCFERGGPCGTTDNVRCAMRDIFGQPVRLIENENEGDKPCSNSKTASSSRG